MDFASLMSAAISKDKSSAPPDKKYLKRSEIEEQRRAAYLEEQAKIEAEKEAKAAAKRQQEEEEAAAKRERDEKRRKLKEESKKRREQAEGEEESKRRKKLGLPELEESKDEDDGRDGDIPDTELQSKLRAMGEPAILFGESYKARLRRYKKLSVVMTQTVIPTILELVEEKDMKVSDKVPHESDVEGRKWIFRQLASYFTLVLTEWELALQGTEQETFAGKAAWRAWVESRENMIPVSIVFFSLQCNCANTYLQLIRRFETNTLDPSILPPMLEIVKAAQERRYVDANDGYLRLSIGKAAWPIGVTMVGIHERSAREKLHESDKGHVMRDEITRKFLQSIKRCLTFAQVKWPPEDVRQLMG